jgi:hypothetical protein
MPDQYQPSFWERRNFALLISGILSVLLLLITAQLPFFWDTLQLSSRQASHFYEGGGWLLPDAIDSGHPPGFGAYLSSWWQLLGRTLFVSHLAMLPWTWLLFYQLMRLCQELFGRYAPLAFFVCLAEAVLGGQLLLVSPDVVLLAAFLWGYRKLPTGNSPWNWSLTLAVLILALTSTRGWMAAFTLYLLALVPLLIKAFNSRAETTSVSFFKTAGQYLLPFLPGGLVAIAYLYFHYAAKGWISFHPDSPWAASFNAVSIQGVLRNLGLIGWRMLDNGKIIGWLLLAYALYRRGPSNLLKSADFRKLLSGFLLFLVVIVPLIVVRTGLTGPRYLLPAILLFDLLLLYALIGAAPLLQSWQRSAWLGFAVALLAGNFLIYPHRIAQAWDATPAHLPYYQQQAAAIDYLNEQNIELTEVGTVFPSYGPRDWHELPGQTSGFARYEQGQQDYIFLSLIHNDWSDADLDRFLGDQVAKDAVKSTKVAWRVIWREDHPLGMWSLLLAREE